MQPGVVSLSMTQGQTPAAAPFHELSTKPIGCTSGEEQKCVDQPKRSGSADESMVSTGQAKGSTDSVDELIKQAIPFMENDPASAYRLFKKALSVDGTSGE